MHIIGDLGHGLYQGDVRRNGNTGIGRSGQLAAKKKHVMDIATYVKVQKQPATTKVR